MEGTYLFLYISTVILKISLTINCSSSLATPCSILLVVCTSCLGWFSFELEPVETHEILLREFCKENQTYDALESHQYPYFHVHAGSIERNLLSNENLYGFQADVSYFIPFANQRTVFDQSERDLKTCLILSLTFEVVLYCIGVHIST